MRSTILRMALCVSMLGGCAQFEELTATKPKSAGVAGQPAAGGRADTLYISPAASAVATTYRNVYISRPNLANMQVIQPEGGYSDGEWWVTDEEAGILQRAITYEFTLALLYNSAFNIVQSPDAAQLVVHTALVALHPNQTRAASARQGDSGGSITVSIAVVSASREEVLVRSVETWPDTDIWAFNEVRENDEALSRIFRAAGNELRRGLLAMQGRNDSPGL